MNIKEDIKIIEWFNLFDLSQRTKEMYLTYMNDFCKCINKSPSELVNESIQEIKQGKLPAEQKIKTYVAQYKRCMNDKGLSPKSQSVALSTIKSFFKANDIPLSAAIRTPKKPMPLRENLTLLKYEDIQKLIINAKSLRDKAMILLMCTSGLARNEIRNLRLKDIIFDDDIGIINIRRQKSQVDFFTFCSPETTIAIKNYLEERKRLNGNIDKNDLLFVTYSKNPHKIANNTFSLIFEQLAEQLGYQNGNFHILCKPHAFRKFFSSTLNNAGFPHDKVDFLLGHKQSNIDIAYYPQEIEKLKELYKTYLQHLTFEKTITVNTLDNEKLLQVEKENQELKSKILELDNFISEIREKMNLPIAKVWTKK